MLLLPLTFLSCLLNVFFTDPSQPSQTKILSTANDVKPGAINILYQSTDGGQTWQDISYGLPENVQPEGFFAGASEVYIRINNVTYRSKSNLKTPVWEKETALNTRSASLAFDRSEDLVESNGVRIGTGEKGIRRSTDHGEHWEWVISEGGVGIAVERITGGFAVISYSSITKSRRIRISLDHGKTWQAIDDGLPPSLSISSIKQVGHYLLCGHPDGIFRSSDMGKTWYVVHPGVDTFRISLGDTRNNPGRVFKLYVSGNTVYAVAGSAGC